MADYNLTEIYQGTTNQATISNTVIDTSGLTVYIYCTPVDTSDDESTKVEIGSASGATAGTNINVTCDWSGLAIGRYYLEVVADPGGVPIVMIPNGSNDFLTEYIDIRDSYAISD